MSVEWTDQQLMDWYMRHSDTWHPGSREECDHCREMIRAFGPMPPAELIYGFDYPFPKAGRTKKSISEGTRWLVWERDNFTCQHCGSRRYLTVDHIVPESKGGAHDMGNFQTLCRRCNSKKGATQ